ncbi:MAG: hypothetical protein AABX53_01320 [Nanoarchaeota archaeon]
MVLCWIALPVFVLLGLFSVKYRRLAKESLDCIWRMTTFRPCRSSLDERLRSDITGTLMKRTPRLARLFYHQYKVISILFLILMIASTYVTGIGIYNYIQYGNCNGADSTAFCVINAALGQQTQTHITANQSALDCFNQTTPFERP